MKRIAIAAVLFAIPSPPADACSGSTSGYAIGAYPKSGHRPWIGIGDLAKIADADIRLRITVPGCGETALCNALPIPLQKIGVFYRPWFALPSGVSVDAMMETTVIGSWFVRDEAPATSLVAYTEWGAATGYIGRANAACMQDGPVVSVSMKSVVPEEDDRLVLVYLEKPTAPDRGIVGVVNLASKGTLELEMGRPVRFASATKLPVKLWLATTDAEGHIGDATEISVSPVPAPR